MNHIFNISKILEKFKVKPRAQRVQKLMNDNEFEKLNKEQTIELINIIDTEAKDTIQIIKDNSPHF